MAAYVISEVEARNAYTGHHAERVAAAQRTYEAPRTPTEEAVAAVWAEVLGRDGIGVTDDFFEIGGHSLLATQIMSRLRERFHVDLAMRALFEYPSIRGLAEAVERAVASGVQTIEPEIVPIPREVHRPCIHQLFEQQAARTPERRRGLLARAPKRGRRPCLWRSPILQATRSSRSLAPRHGAGRPWPRCVYRAPGSRRRFAGYRR